MNRRKFIASALALLTYATPLIANANLPLMGVGSGAASDSGGWDSNRYFFNDIRFRLDATTTNPGTSGLNNLSRRALITADACVNPRFVFINFYGKEATSPPEVDGANAITIDGATVENTNTSSFTAMLFSGVSSVAIAAGGFAISDPVPITIPAGSIASVTTGFYARTSATLASSGQSLVGFLNLNATLPGEHSSAAASLGVQSWTLTSGVATGSNTTAYAPFMICTSPTPVKSELLVGDSITEGKGDQFKDLLRGAFGYPARWLDGATGGPISHINFATAGNSPAASSEGALTNGHYGRRAAVIAGIAALNAGSAPPMTGTLSMAGTNDAANLVADMPAWWTLLHSFGAKVTQTTLTPHTGDPTTLISACPPSTSDNCFTNNTTQVPQQGAYNPSGTVATWDHNLRNNAFACAGAATNCTDSIVDIAPGAFTDEDGLCLSGTQSGCDWAVPPGSFVFVGSNTPGTSIVLNICPAVGANLVMEPGTPQNEAYGAEGVDAGGFKVTAAVFTTTCAVTLRKATLQTHANGAIVLLAKTNSGLHPNMEGAQEIATVADTYATIHGSLF